MSKIISIGTAVPSYCHRQEDILQFMQTIYACNEAEKRRLKFLYHQSGIRKRYSVIPDYSLPAGEWTFLPQAENLEPIPSIEKRMAIFHKEAPLLSIKAINDCLNAVSSVSDITHLITVSCTGLSAPGLDLQLVEALNFRNNIFRTSVNFMGCYAAIHALKLADSICKGSKEAMVLIVCTELCTLHFQNKPTVDNITSSLLFGDGAASVLVVPDEHKNDGLLLDGFYSEVMLKGKKDMAWELSSSGFLMTLSNYIPDLIEEDFYSVAIRSLSEQNISLNDISGWCIHPGGKRILRAIEKSIGLSANDLEPSYEVLGNYGNMSSATILFVLKNIMQDKTKSKKVFGAAFGPGLTVETFVASS